MSNSVCIYTGLIVFWNNIFGQSLPIYPFALRVFSPNAGKYGPEKTPHLDTFHAFGLLSGRVRSGTKSSDKS